ncbi:Phage protein GP46 [compost metagenome]
MDRQLNPHTGDYTGQRTTGIENAVYLRLTTPLDSYWADRSLGSRLHLLPRKDEDATRQLAQQYAWQALQPLMEDGRATAITVHAQSAQPGWLSLTIAVTQAGGDVATFTQSVKVL